MREITDPYLIWNKTTGRPTIIQRDGCYLDLGNYTRHSAALEGALINSGFYSRIMDEIEKQNKGNK